MKRTELLALQAEIESDLADLARVVEEIRETAQALPSQEDPFHKDKAALGAFVHSFYNGVENVLKRLAQEIDRSVPTGRGGLGPCCAGWRPKSPESARPSCGGKP